MALTPEEKVDPFEGAEEHNKSILMAMRPGRDDRVILEKSMEDVEKGFAIQPMLHNELVEHLGGKKFRLIRRFVITQSTGTENHRRCSIRGAVRG